MFRFTDLIIFRMTRDCNLNCKYCFMLEKEKYKDEIIDFELFKKIVLKIIQQRKTNNRNNQLHFILHGGELLLLGYKKLNEILEFITIKFKENNINYSLGCQTNATLLTEEIAQLFNKFNVNVGLSFDGINDSSRNNIKQEVFESKFKILNDSNVKYSFIVVASKNNIENLNETKKYLDDLQENNKILGYKINYAEDMINPGECSLIELSGKTIFEKVWKPTIEDFIQGKKIIENNSMTLLEKTLVDILSNHENNSRSGCNNKWCGAGVSIIAIEPDGNINLCDRYSKDFDDIFIQHSLDNDFLGLNQLNEVIKYNLIKDKIYHDCDTCFADYVCDHGCFAFHYSKYGEYGIDTRLVCDQYKDLYTFIQENIKEILESYEHQNKSISSRDNLLSIKDLKVLKYFDLKIKDNKIEIGKK